MVIIFESCPSITDGLLRRGPESIDSTPALAQPRLPDGGQA